MNSREITIFCLGLVFGCVFCVNIVYWKVYTKPSIPIVKTPAVTYIPPNPMSMPTYQIIGTITYSDGREEKIKITIP